MILTFFYGLRQTCYLKKPSPTLPIIENELLFSSASIWEIIIKKSLNRPDFQIDPNALYWGLLDNGYTEINITSHHALLVASLPSIHKDPFDRILITQAKAEKIVLLTSDKTLASYSSTIFIEQ